MLELVREGGRRMHRSWEEGAGREQVRREGRPVQEGREERAVSVGKGAAGIKDRRDHPAGDGERVGRPGQLGRARA